MALAWFYADVRPSVFLESHYLRDHWMLHDLYSVFICHPQAAKALPATKAYLGIIHKKYFLL